jgi:hypothetical protein
MDHRQKVDHLLDDLSRRGIGRYTTAPPIYRMLWAAGLEVPPPHFSGFWTLTLFMGVVFGVLWGVLMWLIHWRQEGMPVAAGVVTSLLAGLGFGLIMAAYYRWRARKLALPRWEDYPGGR